MCTIQSNNGNVTRYINNGKSSEQQSKPSLGLSDIVVTNNNGILRCQFSRTKRIVDEEGYFDLFSPYYILLAKGSLSGSIKSLNNFKAYNRV